MKIGKLIAAVLFLSMAVSASGQDLAAAAKKEKVVGSTLGEVDRGGRHPPRRALSQSAEGSWRRSSCWRSGIRSKPWSSRIVSTDNATKASCAPSEAGARNTLVALSERKSLPRRELRLRSSRVRRGDLHGKPALRGENRK